MRKKILLAIAFSLGIWSYLLLLAATPKPGATPPQNLVGPEDGITHFFSPGGGCTEAIVAEIAKAAKTIDIQAYSFTSPPIAQALIDACDRGVHVRIILDKAERTDHYSSAPVFLSHHIQVYIDDQHAMAHNNVVMIDGKLLMTGSFNFTKSSEDKNAENFLILHDRPKATGAYHANFEHHLSHSIPMAVETK